MDFRYGFRYNVLGAALIHAADNQSRLLNSHFEICIGTFRVYIYLAGKMSLRESGNYFNSRSAKIIETHSNPHPRP